MTDVRGGATVEHSPVSSVLTEDRAATDSQMLGGGPLSSSAGYLYKPVNATLELGSCPSCSVAVGLLTESFPHHPPTASPLSLLLRLVPTQFASSLHPSELWVLDSGLRAWARALEDVESFNSAAYAVTKHATPTDQRGQAIVRSAQTSGTRLSQLAG